MEYEFKHVVNFLVIVNEPIDIFDLFTRSDDEAFKKAFKLQAPISYINPNFSFSSQPSFFIINKFIEGYDIAVFNINYGNNIIRGAFRITKNINNSDTNLDEEIFAKLKNLVAKLNYTNVFAYEISISGIINYKNYENFKKAENLQTMPSPKYRSIKIIDGVNGNANLREQYISEIDLEQNVNDPSKSNLTAVYRTPDFYSNSLTKLLEDINKIINIIK